MVRDRYRGGEANVVKAHSLWNQNIWCSLLGTQTVLGPEDEAQESWYAYMTL